jgi:hypothetical protein
MRQNAFPKIVIPGLDPGISGRPGDGRVEPGHDEAGVAQSKRTPL